MCTQYNRDAQTGRTVQLVSLKLIVFCFSLLFFSSCTIKESFYTYGQTSYSGFNMHRKNKPLLVVLPEVQQTLLDQEAINTLAKKYRVLYIPFAEEGNFVRQMQIDGMSNRINYYSEAFQNVMQQQNQKPDIVLCEGFNTFVMLPLALSFKIEKVVALNGFYPNVYDVLINSCFGSNLFLCDSLQKHLQFIDREELDLLVQHSYKSSSHQQFAQHSSSFWEDAFKQNLSSELGQYNGKIVWLTTTSSGILADNQIIELNKNMSNKASIKLISEKDLAKNWTKYISN